MVLKSYDSSMQDLLLAGICYGNFKGGVFKSTIGKATPVLQALNTMIDSVHTNSEEKDVLKEFRDQLIAMNNTGRGPNFRDMLAMAPCMENLESMFNDGARVPNTGETLVKKQDSAVPLEQQISSSKSSNPFHAGKSESPSAENTALKARKDKEAKNADLEWFAKNFKFLPRQE